MCQEQQRLKVNLHPTIPLLIRESDLMAKMNLPIPMVALTVFAKQEHFNLIQDTLQFLLKNFLTIVQSVKLEVRPLFLPHLVKLIKIIEPGLKQLTWVSEKWKPYTEQISNSIKNFKILVDRVHDIYNNRIVEVLDSMQSILLHALPDLDEEPWTIEDFIEKIDIICRNAATELQRKSLMIEEAVEEILSLVRNTRIDTSSPTQDELLFDGTYNYISNIRTTRYDCFICR